MRGKSCNWAAAAALACCVCCSLARRASWSGLVCLPLSRSLNPAGLARHRPRLKLAQVDLRVVKMQDGSPINPPQPPSPPPPLSADVGEQRVKKMEDDEPLRTPRAPPPVKAAHRSLKEHLTVSSLRWHLLAISFGTGLLDAATYSDLGIFASNQTGERQGGSARDGYGTAG